MIKKYAFGAVLLLSASPAMAGVTCQGAVTTITMEPNGDTYVDWGSWSMRICNQSSTVTVDRGGMGGGTTIAPMSCTALTSLFMTAKASGTQVAVHKDGSSCDFSQGYLVNYPYKFTFINN